MQSHVYGAVGFGKQYPDYQHFQVPHSGHGYYEGWPSVVYYVMVHFVIFRARLDDRSWDGVGWQVEKQFSFGGSSGGRIAELRGCGLALTMAHLCR